MCAWDLHFLSVTLCGAFPCTYSPFDVIRRPPYCRLYRYRVEATAVLRGYSSSLHHSAGVLFFLCCCLDIRLFLTVFAVHVEYFSTYSFM